MLYIYYYILRHFFTKNNNFLVIQSTTQSRIGFLALVRATRKIRKKRTNERRPPKKWSYDESAFQATEHQTLLKVRRFDNKRL